MLGGDELQNGQMSFDEAHLKRVFELLQIDHFGRTVFVLIVFGSPDLVDDRQGAQTELAQIVQLVAFVGDRLVFNEIKLDIYQERETASDLAQSIKKDLPSVHTVLSLRRLAFSSSAPVFRPFHAPFSLCDPFFRAFYVPYASPTMTLSGGLWIDAGDLLSICLWIDVGDLSSLGFWVDAGDLWSLGF